MTESVGVGMTSRPAARHGAAIRTCSEEITVFAQRIGDRTPFCRGGKREKVGSVDHKLTIASTFPARSIKETWFIAILESILYRPPTRSSRGTTSLRG